MNPYQEICDIIDDYQFDSTSKVFSQIISDNQWKRFLMENILLKEDMVQPKEFKIVQKSIAKWR